LFEKKNIIPTRRLPKSINMQGKRMYLFSAVTNLKLIHKRIKFATNIPRKPKPIFCIVFWVSGVNGILNAS